jgi:hypothetical protein
MQPASKEKELTPQSSKQAHPPNGDRLRELELLRRLAASHHTCADERPRIDGDAIVIPFDCRQADATWTIEYERVRNRRELLDALGY